ncbi:MAG: hypothetical protein FJ125_00915 [Deltaproteobacteria bacterium]|nr:hypothetical protein [Deltaproteobacteria bacterium]
MDLVRIATFYAFGVVSVVLWLPLLYLLRALAPPAKIPDPALGRLHRLSEEELRALFPQGGTIERLVLPGTLAALRVRRPDGLLFTLLRFANPPARLSWTEELRRSKARAGCRIRERDGMLLYQRSDGGAGALHRCGEVLAHVEGASPGEVLAPDWCPNVDNPRANRLTRLFGRPAIPLLAGGLLAYGLLWIVPWLHLASWASEVLPIAGNPVASEQSLAEELLRLDRPDLPYHVVRDAEGALRIEWKLQDALWADVIAARWREQPATSTLVLRLDGREHVVRVLERSYALSWEPGPAGPRPRLVPRRSLGLPGFSGAAGAGGRADHWGLSFEDGHLVPDSSYSYSFQLEELKQPLIELFTRQGWTYKPVVSFRRWLAG